MSRVFEGAFGLELAQPAFLLLTLLVPALLWARLGRGSPAIRWAPFDVMRARGGRSSLPATWRSRLRGIPLGLEVAGLLAACIALARPVERTELPSTVQGIDVVLCLDVSWSMTTAIGPTERTRLDAVKSASREFLERIPQHRVALVTFARYPDVRCPLTLDHEAVDAFLEQVETVAEDSPEDATGIGTALARAAQLLEKNTAPSRVVILLTDGEENVATTRTPKEIAPLHAAQLCKELGQRAYTVAATLSGTAAKDSQEETDTTTLRLVAEKTGGRFFSAKDAPTLRGIYEEIETLETIPLEQPVFGRDRFLPFLLAAVLILVLAGIVHLVFFGGLP